MAVVDMTKGDFKGGDPARHVVGKPPEQAARRHGKKPERRITGKTIHTDIKFRMAFLQPYKEEYELLTRAYDAIKGI